ncbi:ATP phosphoribosyltransferase regulatory subunit [Peloplasma aerotolerans]|uniref:ATP phosphoribosyltransferase regulatory subunit n=1 Tax=Peloplasma aerotolerans TaxID=3044389 RepID=A0AAW6U6N2_9MOLU|nr:ATP phosphoribosyltransferase regulatory subunit [Mariniplasma sp. M4Ah]MDI6453621.1 ATP phosphoribosyltransferase regulatory subunit [Mariniplasma sp. M4Ah]
MQFTNIKEEIKYLNFRYELNQKLEKLVYEKGYIKVEPDYFEPYDWFINMNKRVNKNELVKLLNNDGSISILRPDVTSNIIKQVIPKIENDEIMKMFYLSTTFSQRSSKRIEETKQFGVEYLGSRETADIEVMSLIMHIFESFNKRFLLEIGNQKFIEELIRSLRINLDQERILKSIIFDKNHPELMQFIKTQVSTEINTHLISSIFELQGSLKSILKRLEEYVINSDLKKAIEELKTLNEKLLENDNNQMITYDLSLISKYDYYDGITFKGYLENVPTPILSGGRYDQMTKQFGKIIPATGFSLNLSELIKAVIT